MMVVVVGVVVVVVGWLEVGGLARFDATTAPLRQRAPSRPFFLPVSHARIPFSPLFGLSDVLALLSLLRVPLAFPPLFPSFLAPGGFAGTVPRRRPNPRVHRDGAEHGALRRRQQAGSECRGRQRRWSGLMGQGQHLAMGHSFVHLLQLLISAMRSYTMACKAQPPSHDKRRSISVESAAGKRR